MTNNQRKYIQSLQQKKFRQNYEAFLVEGAKNVFELLNSDFLIEILLFTPDFYKENKDLLLKQPFEAEIVSETELERLGSLQSNNAALAVAKKKPNLTLLANENEFVLVLDEIKDPGNLGTIIRIADWYGINKIICSENTVEFYNPKVISATMGSFCRVKLFYTDLENYLKNSSLPIYGAFLDGENIHKQHFEKGGYIVMGNESNGISENVGKFVNYKITIPRFGGAESLNVGVATAVVLDNLRRGF